MAKSLKQVLQQINKLQLQADAIRSKEVAEVVERIRVAIEHYGLTPQDLFGNKVRGAAKGSVDKKAATAGRGRAATAKRSGVAKYASGDGRTWTGTGKRPTWFVEALAAGKTAQDLLIDPSSASTAASPSGKRQKKAVAVPASAGARKAARSSKAGNTQRSTQGVPKYQGGAGKTWTGVGKRPTWFVQALAEGRQAEDLLIPAT